MQVGIERESLRLDRLDAVPRHDFVKLLLNHVEPRRDAFGPFGSQGVDRTVEVIEGIKQVFRQRSDRVNPIGVGLLLGASDNWRTRPMPAGLDL